MKIGYFTDIHIRGKSPVNRIDNYTDSIFEKFTEAIEIFDKEKVNIIICGGDLFDSPVVSLTLVDEAIKRFMLLNCPILINPGNHDIFQGNWENSKASSLAHLFNLPLEGVCITTAEWKETKKDQEIQIIGYPYYHGIENDIRKEGLYHEIKNKNTVTIAVPHILITEKSLPYQAFHVPYKELKTNYDFVLVSHNHFEFGIKEVGKTKIVSIGALCRLSAHPKDYTRQPKVAIIDTETKEVKTINLQTAKPINEIFNLEALEERKKSEAGLSQFIERLKSTKIQSLNLHEIITEIGQTKNVDKIVLDEIKKRIGEFEDE